MQSVEEIVLSQLRGWLEAGQRAWLCTIIGAVGASPRPVGSLLAVNERGDVAGSLSGGCIEEELLERLHRGELAESAPQQITYGVTAEENERLGLPCGGRLQVLVEPFSAKPAGLDEILSSLSSRRVARRRVDLQNGHWEVTPVERAARLSSDERYLVQDFGPRFQLLLMGANELARCISEIALAMDYRVVVCDPRPALREQWSLAEVEVVADMPDDAVRKYAGDSHSIVITLTHDPRIDDMALMEALTGDSFYVGALGSSRTSEKRRRRLQALDLTEEQIARLHAPVGLSIGSKSAMEIAVAVMAELVQLRKRAEAASRA